VAQYVIPTLQSTEGRVNARETGAGCNDWISWGNNYSVWPPRIEALEKLPGRSRLHKTTPVQSSVSYLAGCGKTISDSRTPMAYTCDIRKEHSRRMLKKTSN